MIHPSKLFLPLILLVLWSCGDIKDSEEYKKVVFDRDSLSETLISREEEVNEFAKEFDRIEKNLTAIDTNKAKLIALSDNRKISQKEHIHHLIADIYIAVDQNQTLVKNLEQKIKTGSNTQGLNSIIGSLKKSLIAKELEIESLKKEYSTLQFEVRSLKDAVAYKENLLASKDTLLTKQGEKIRKQEQLILQKEAEMNRAYYFRGTTKELEKAGIIRKEGGIAGLGSVKVLGEKLGGDKMKVLNIKSDKMLLIGRYKKKKVVSSHPSDSYFFIAKEGQLYLKISFPERFWGVSKYLVIAVE